MSARDGFTLKMNEWCDVIGISEESALKLTNQYGGRRWTIPKKLPQNQGHWLIECIGFEDAQKMSEYYCGEDLDIPFGPNSPYRLRRRKARALAATGLTNRQISEQCGITQRNVIRNVKGTANKKADPNQLDFFPDHHPMPPEQRKQKRVQNQK